MTRTTTTALSALAAVALLWVSASGPVLAQTNVPAPANPAPAIMDTSPRPGTLGNSDTPTGLTTQEITSSASAGGSGSGLNLYRDKAGYGTRRY